MEICIPVFPTGSVVQKSDDGQLLWLLQEGVNWAMLTGLWRESAHIISSPGYKTQIFFNWLKRPYLPVGTLCSYHMFMRLSCSIQSIGKTSCRPFPASSPLTSCLCNFYVSLNRTLFRSIVAQWNIPGSAGQGSSSRHGVSWLTELDCLFVLELPNNPVLSTCHIRIYSYYNLTGMLDVVPPLAQVDCLFKGWLYIARFLF